MVEAPISGVTLKQRRGQAAFFAIFQPFFAPLLVAIGAGLVFLVAVYSYPLDIMQDIGAAAAPGIGWYPNEHNAAFSYAYTDGNAAVDLPQAGSGQFIVTLRMGGPNTSVPVA